MASSLGLLVRLWSAALQLCVILRKYRVAGGIGAAKPTQPSMWKLPDYAAKSGCSSDDSTVQREKLTPGSTQRNAVNPVDVRRAQEPSHRTPG